MNYPDTVKIVEVGPRDGLQNESALVSVVDKVWLIERLADAGLCDIEAGSFVSPKWVPQMADSDKVFAQISRKTGVTYAALTPNLKGFDAAMNVNVDQIAVFAAASEAFSQKNINCSIDESIARFQPVIEAALKNNIPVRGYVSCVLGCPYQGHVDIAAVKDVTDALFDIGCYEVSLGDTIGTGTPLKTNQLLALLLSQIPADKLALHMHDTYGQALANVLIGLQQGINTFDASIAGLGGCPYAKGASGNLATEDLLYMLDNMGLSTGVDLQKLVNLGNEICTKLGRDNMSKVGKALYKP